MWSSLILFFIVVNKGHYKFSCQVFWGRLHRYLFFKCWFILNTLKTLKFANLLGLIQIFCFKETELSNRAWRFLGNCPWFCSSPFLPRDNYFPKVMSNISTQALIFSLYMYISLNNTLWKFLSVSYCTSSKICFSFNIFYKCSY